MDPFISALGLFIVCNFLAGSATYRHVPSRGTELPNGCIESDNKYGFDCNPYFCKGDEGCDVGVLIAAHIALAKG